jgi:hypothetical protein
MYATCKSAIDTYGPFKEGIFEGKSEFGIAPYQYPHWK